MKEIKMKIEKGTYKTIFTILCMIILVWVDITFITLLKTLFQIL